MARARNPFLGLKDIPEADKAVACDGLKDRGWEVRRLDIGDAAYLVPLSLPDASILARAGLPHVHTLRTQGGKVKKAFDYFFFPRPMLLDYCDFLHVSPASSISSDRPLVPADLLNTIPPAMMAHFARQVADGSGEAMSPHYRSTRGPLSGRGRARRARVRPGGLLVPLIDALADGLPHVDLGGDPHPRRLGRVFHLSGLMDSLTLAATWVEHSHGVRPDPAAIIEEF